MPADASASLRGIGGRAQAWHHRCEAPRGHSSGHSTDSRLKAASADGSSTDAYLEWRMSQLRFDAVYEADGGPTQFAYFRFFPRGMVMSWLAGNRRSAEEAFGRLVTDPNGFGAGDWSVEGNQVYFHQRFPGATIEYSGKILEDRLDLMLNRLDSPHMIPSWNHYLRPISTQTWNGVRRAVEAMHFKVPPYLEEGEFPVLRIRDRGYDAYSCDPRGLDSSRTNWPHVPHWATPVFFGQQVLEAYSRPGSLYEVTMDPLNAHLGTVSDTRRDWQMEVDFIEVGVIMGRLGAIGEMRNFERTRWARFNIEPHAKSWA